MYNARKNTSGTGNQVDSEYFTKVINYKLAKAKEDLLFTEERYIEKIEFNLAQSNLAKYRDANKNINSAIALTEIQRLELYMN